MPDLPKITKDVDDLTGHRRRAKSLPAAVAAVAAAVAMGAGPGVTSLARATPQSTSPLGTVEQTAKSRAKLVFKPTAPNARYAQHDSHESHYSHESHESHYSGQ